MIFCILYFVFCVLFCVLEPQREQTIFEVILKGFKDDKKVAVIKEVRQMFNLGLKDVTSYFLTIIYSIYICVYQCF